MSEHRGPDPEIRKQLLAATRRAAEAAGKEPSGGAGPPRPGDLYVLPATADFDVEWLVTARPGDDPGRLRVVAAVGEEALGSGDVEVTEEAGGPLVLRCRHRLWLPTGFLEADLRRGRVPAGRAAEAEARCAALDAGPVVGSPLQRETDDDPEYEARDAELAAARDALLVAAARWGAAGGGAPGASGGGTAPAPTHPRVDPQVPGETAPEIGDDREAPDGDASGDGGGAPDPRGAAGPGGPPPGAAGSDPGYAQVSPFRRPRRRTTSQPLLRLAAGLLLAALGLTAWWGLALRGELGEVRDDLAASREPQLDPIPAPIPLGPTRSPDVYTVVRAGDRLLLRLYWQDLPWDRPYRVEIADPDGGMRLRTETLVPGDLGERTLRIHRSQLPPGRYQLRVLEVGDASPEPVYEQPIQVPPEAPPEDAAAP